MLFEWVMRLVKALWRGVLTVADIGKVKQIMAPFSQPDIDRAWNAAVAIHQARQEWPGAAPSDTLAGVLAGHGWDVATEGVSPTGGSSLWAKVTVVSVTEDGEKLFRTIKIALPFGATMEELQAAIDQIIAGWQANYPGNQIDALPDTLVVF